ncbi:MAG: hypothetical protein AB8G11_02335 [Saprospiraceae bacterium]
MWYNYDVSISFNGGHLYSMTLDLRWYILMVFMVINYFSHKHFKPKYLEYGNGYGKQVSQLYYMGTYLAIALLWLILGNLFLW